MSIVPKEVQALELSGQGVFVTDPDAEAGSYEAKLHDAHSKLNAYIGSAETKNRFTFEAGTSLIARVIAPLVWLVRGFIPERSVIVIAGEPKTSKTWLAITFGMVIAAGVSLFNAFSAPFGERREVAYFAIEDSERSFRTRLIALAAGLGLEVTKAVEHFHVRCRSSLNLLNDRDLCELIAACPDNLAALFIDPLRDAHTGEENSSGDMAEVMRRLRFLRDTLGCAVVFVHHSAKASADKASRRPGQMMRGSSAVHGAIDGGIYLMLTNATETEWINTVQVELKAAKGAGTFGLTLNVEDDANGEARLAKWTYSAEPTAKGAGELASHVDQLVEILRLKFERNAPGSRGMNREDVRAGLGVGMAKANAAVAEAIRSNLARYAKDEGGTVYLPPLTIGEGE